VNGFVPVERVRVPLRIREYISLENVIVIVPFSGKFTHFSGKFTRFVWDKKTSQYPINAFPSTLYSGSDASLVPACPRLSHALRGTNNCFTVSIYSHLCLDFRDFLKNKNTLSYSRGKLTISAK
jgi:hypothetical protein